MDANEDERLFSIVIPVFNYAHTLKRAILSVVNQHSSVYENTADENTAYEILVVNDGSTDDSEMLTRTLQQQFPGKITYVYQANQGAATARNAGIRMAKGRYLIFLDADDELMPGTLEKLRVVAISHGQCDLFIGGHVTRFPDGREKTYVPKQLSECNRTNFVDYLEKRLSIVNGATLMKKSIFESLQFDEKLRVSEDIPVFALMLARYKVMSLDFPMALIHKHDDSLRHNVANALAMDVMLVDSIFDSGLLPESLGSYRTQFLAQKCLSTFRTLYLAGEYKISRSYYYRAVKARPVSVFRLAYLRKFLRSLLVWQR